MSEPFSTYEDIEIDGSKVAALRMNRVPRMSQGRLAQLVGISRGRIAQIELQERVGVRLRTATMLASALEASLDDFKAAETSLSGGLGSQRAWATPPGSQLEGAIEKIHATRAPDAGMQPSASDSERKERMLRDLVKLLEDTWSDPLLSADRLATVSAFIAAGLEGL